MKPSDTLDPLLSRLYAVRDNEIEAEIVARAILNQGPVGIDALAQTLRDQSAKAPKLAIGILNAIRSSMNPYARQRLSQLVEENSLTEEDAAYALSILAQFESIDPATKTRLVQKLQRVKDPVSRSEVLANIVRYRIVEARDQLIALVSGTQPDYRQNPEQAAREEMVRFALDALDGKHEELESIVFDPQSHAIRRSAALEFLSLVHGDASGSLLKRAFNSESREMRVAVMRAAVRLPFREAVEILSNGLKDADGWVSFVAASGLGPLLDSSESSENLDKLSSLKDLVDSVAQHRESDRTLVKVLRRLSARLGSLIRED